MSSKAGFGNPFALERQNAERRDAFRARIAAESRAAREQREAAKSQRVPKAAGKSAVSHEASFDSERLVGPALDDLFQSSGLETRGPEQWQRVLDASAVVLGLWDEGKLVAFARMTESEDGTECTFHDAVVRPEYRGRGLLSRMQDLAGEVMDTHSYSRALIEAVPGSEDMYRHLGWQPVTPDVTTD